jgi:hypothetical protein
MYEVGGYQSLRRQSNIFTLFHPVIFIMQQASWFWRDGAFVDVRLTTVRTQGIKFVSAAAVVACVLFFFPSRDMYL